MFKMAKITSLEWCHKLVLHSDDVQNGEMWNVLNEEEMSQAGYTLKWCWKKRK